MPATPVTRSALRRKLVTRVLTAGESDSGTLASSGGASTATLADLADKYTNSHFAGGTIVLRAGDADAEERFVKTFDGATGAITVIPAWTLAPASSDAYEIYASTVDVPLLNQGINDAISIAHLKWPVPDEDSDHCSNWRDRQYPVDTDWIAVNEVYAARRILSGDRFGPRGNDFYNTEKTITATTQRLAQQVYLGEQARVAAIWVPLRMVGTVAGTFALKWYSDDGSDLPDTLLAPFGTSDSFSASSIGREMTLYRVPFSSPPAISALTDMHFVVDPTSLTGLDASNYLAWGASSDGGYSFGSPSLSTDSGATYTSDTSFSRWFAIETTEPEWAELNWHHWRIIKSATRKVELKRDLPYGTPIRLLGQMWQAPLDDDTDTCLLPENWLLDVAAYAYLAGTTNGNDGLMRLAESKAQKAAEYLATSPALVRDRLTEGF